MLFAKLNSQWEWFLSLMGLTPIQKTKYTGNPQTCVGPQRNVQDRAKTSPTDTVTNGPTFADSRPSWCVPALRVYIYQ